VNATNENLPGSHAVTAEVHFIEEIIQHIGFALFQPIYDQLPETHASTAAAS